MEELCLAVGMFGAALVVPAAVIALVAAFGLARRVQRLEARLVELEQRLVTLPAAAALPGSTGSGPVEADRQTVAAPAGAQAPGAAEGGAPATAPAAGAPGAGAPGAGAPGTGALPAEAAAAGGAAGTAGRWLGGPVADPTAGGAPGPGGWTTGSEIGRPEAAAPTGAPGAGSAAQPSGSTGRLGGPRSPLGGASLSGLQGRLPSPERLAVWLAAGVGGFALLLAALFALVAVIEQGWIGPSARITLGFVGGTGLWVGGAWARRRWPAVGSALSGVGVGTLYGTAYAGSGLYALLPPAAASGIMIAVTAIATVRATVDQDRFVAWLALLGGLLTPWLVSSGEDRPYALFLYVALLTSGIVAAARSRSWPDLVVGAALGAGALHVGWTTTGYTAAHVPAALAGAALVTLPFALGAAPARGAVGSVGQVAAAVLPLVAAPWVVPVGGAFVDPRSGLWSMRSEPLAAPLTALALVALPLPGLLVARWRRSTVRALVGLAPVLVLSWVAAVGALATTDVPSGWIAAGAVGPAVALAAVGLGDRDAARGFAPSLLVAGIALMLVVTVSPAPAVAVAVLAVIGAAALVGSTVREGWVAPLGLAAVTLPLWVAEGAYDDAPARYLVGPTLIALVAFVQGPLRIRWVRGVELGWATAAAAGPALFPPLYGSWVERLGDDVVGVLPLLLAGYVLLAGVALARREKLPSGSLVVAVFTVVVLLGVTAAVPLQLRERWVTVAWALEAAGLAYVARWVHHPLVRWTAVGLCAAVGVRLLLNPWALGWGTADEGWVVLNWTLYSWGVPLACVLLVARWLPGADAWLARARLPLWVMAALIGFALVNVEVSHAFQPHGALELTGVNRLQSMVRSASWAAYGLLVLGIGLAIDQRLVRFVGFAFVLLATLKVFGIDLWDLRGFVRVGSIACLGVSLLLAALAFERLVLRSSTRAAPPADPETRGGARSGRPTETRSETPRETGSETPRETGSETPRETGSETRETGSGSLPGTGSGTDGSEGVP